MFINVILKLIIVHTYIPLTFYSRRGSRDTSDIPPRPTVYQNDVAMRKADVTDGKSIAVWSQSISGVSAINPLVAFFDIHGRKREVLFFYFVPDTTQDNNNNNNTYIPLTLYSRKGSRGISDIPPRRPCFIKIT
jgi:hypothetical protein